MTTMKTAPNAGQTITSNWKTDPQERPNWSALSADSFYGGGSRKGGWIGERLSVGLSRRRKVDRVASVIASIEKSQPIPRRLDKPLIQQYAMTQHYNQVGKHSALVGNLCGPRKTFLTKSWISFRGRKKTTELKPKSVPNSLTTYNHQ